MQHSAPGAPAGAVAVAGTGIGPAPDAGTGPAAAGTGIGATRETVTIAETDFFAGLPSATRTRYAALDLYTPGEPERRRPAVVLVHGGPIAADRVPTPRDSAMFAGYGALAAAHGLTGVMFDHRTRTHDGSSDVDEFLVTAYPGSADDLVATVERARGLDQVDPDRVAIWFFSLGGGLAADWLRATPSWLRAVAWTYPVLAPTPDWDGDVERFDCVRAITGAPDLPKLMVRVGAEYPQLTRTQQATVDAARESGSALEVMDLPWAAHGYECQGRLPDARAVTERAMAWVAAALGVDGR